MPTPLKCANNLGEDASLSGPVPANLQPKAFDLLPLGSTVPDGWLLNQLVLQANSLSGWMAISTFPGAVDVNTSLWIGGDGKTGGKAKAASPPTLPTLCQPSANPLPTLAPPTLVRFLAPLPR